MSSLISSLVADPLAASARAEGKGEGRRDAFFAEQDLESALRELRKLVDAWLLWQDELERSKAEALSARQRTEALRHELASLRRKMDKEQGIFAELEKEWQHWLAERELQASSSPETVMDLFGFAEQGMELVRRLDWLDRKMRGLEQEIRAYEEECRLVLPDREESGPSTFFRLEAAERAWDEEKKLLRQREIVISRLEPVQEERIRVNGEIEAVTRSMASLLAEAKAADGEQFLRLGAASERRKELERNIRQLTVGMFGGWPREREEALRCVLDEHDAASLDEAVKEAERELGQAELLLSELRQLQGRLLQERDDLARLGAQDTALQQLEEQKAALKDIAGQYAVRALCAEMIANTRSIYEREKQPQLLEARFVLFCRADAGELRQSRHEVGRQKAAGRTSQRRTNRQHAAKPGNGRTAVPGDALRPRREHERHNGRAFAARRSVRQLRRGADVLRPRSGGQAGGGAANHHADLPPLYSGSCKAKAASGRNHPDLSISLTTQTIARQPNSGYSTDKSELNPIWLSRKQMNKTDAVMSLGEMEICCCS